MLKVVYFDEGSALDFIDQYYNGRVQEKETKTQKTETNIDANIELETQIGLPKWMEIIDIVSGKLKAKVGGKIDDTDQYLQQKMVSSTILTSFKKITSSTNSSPNLLVLKNYNLNILPDSLTSIKTLTPFLKMFATQMQTIQIIKGENQTGSQGNNLPNMDVSTLDISNLDTILENAKGYYEMLASNENETKIVRFNLKGLRNNYQLIDFRKMHLTLYGIPVGKCSIDSLKNLNEFDVEQSEQKKTQLAGDALDPDREDQAEVEIIDILLAGVEASE